MPGRNTAKDWRSYATECFAWGEGAQAQGMNLDAELWFAKAAAAAAISTAISTAKPERKPNTGPK